MAFQDNDGGGFQRKMYQGNWTCSKCNKEITELPFEPDPDRVGQLKCKDCFRTNRPPRRDFGR
jgi:CxxC-x17-CxxC domain-containing protein